MSEYSIDENEIKNQNEDENENNQNLIDFENKYLKKLSESDDINTINQIKTIVKKYSSDYFQTLRIYKNSLKIAKKEKTENDLFIICILSLTYEIYNNYYNNNNNNNENNKEKEKDLEFIKLKFIGKNFDCEEIKKIPLINKKKENFIKSIEGKIVQDAFILNLLGAIGISKCFLNGNVNNKKIYSIDENENDDNNCFNEIYEKISDLKKYINTNEGKKIALKKIDFMLKFINQFNNETYLNLFNDENEKFEQIVKKNKKDKIKFFTNNMNEKLSKLFEEEKNNENKRILILKNCDNEIDKKLLEKKFGKERKKTIKELEKKKIEIEKEIQLYKLKINEN